MEVNRRNGGEIVRVPACYLTYENMQLKKRALWGTDIYTDDSDIVAMAIHAGHYQPKYIEPDMDTEDPFALAVAGKSREASEATKRLALSGKKWICKDTLIPEHDLKITVRVLPKLQNYASSIRHRIKSREWGYHDGVSLYIMKAETMEGDARIKGRSSIKSNMFDYEVYRKQALGSHHKPAETVPSITTEKIQGGRIKKTRRVMRMFQMRSELLHSSK
ncbi:histone deacetylation protein Rxt3-domain-containing protein [Pilobolus umbonatus]|nr:histone deacetylation protein Rxt3-domain-containing protein [Pilobolus umbonatus]